MFSHSLRTSILAGNPGVPEYYQQFMHTLWKKSGEKIPVWCVGQAGHVVIPSQPALGWTDIGECVVLQSWCWSWCFPDLQRTWCTAQYW